MPDAIDGARQVLRPLQTPSALETTFRQMAPPKSGHPLRMPPESGLILRRCPVLGGAICPSVVSRAELGFSESGMATRVQHLFDPQQDNDLHGTTETPAPAQFENLTESVGKELQLPPRKV